jgi:predicted nucleic acid-binding protein
VGLKPYYLGDTSALARMTKPTVEPRLMPLIEAGLVARCSPTDLEAGYSAKSGLDYLRIRAARSAWPSVPINQDVLDRASDVQGLLADRSQHRGAAIAELIIAAAAEAADLVVLHYDADFDLIAAVTGQPTEWVVPAGLAD